MELNRLAHPKSVISTYLFVAGRVDDGVSVFKVASDGSLSNVANVNDSENSNYLLNLANSVSTAKVGNSTYLFVTGWIDSGVSVFKVASDGSLRNVDNIADGESCPFSGNDNSLKLCGANATTTAQIGSSTYLFVAGDTDDGVSVFKVANDGKLTNVSNVSNNNNYKLNGASSVSTAQIGGNTYLFVSGYVDAGVSVFRVASNGVLSNVANIDDSENSNYYLDGAESVSTAQIGGNTYLFVSSARENGVSIFRVTSNGNLVNLVNVADSDNINYNLNRAESLSTAQIGNATYLFVAGERDDGVSVFQMDGPANNTFTTALNIRKGQSYSGYISAGSSNYYRVYFSIGSNTFETSGSLDTNCNIYFSNNTNISLESDNNSGTANNCKITYNITTAGYYYLRISGSSNGDYTLMVQ